MKIKSNSWPALLLSALALLAWCGALFFAQAVGARSPGVLVRWEGEGGVSPFTLSRIQRYAAEDGAESAPSASLWRELPGKPLTDVGGKRAWSGTVLELFGSGEDVWPASFLHGGYPVRGDTEGCAVDETVAQALWGTSDVVGEPIQLDGRTIFVRGVFRGGTGLVLTQGEADDTQPYQNLLLCFPGGSTREAAEAWLVAAQAGGSAIVDLPLFAWLLGGLASLPGLLLGLGILLRLLRRGMAFGGAPLTLCAYLVPALALGAAVLWAMGVPCHVPMRLIPTQWSDFDFWSGLVGQLLEEGKGWLSLTPGRRDMEWWSPALGCGILSIAAVGLTVPAAERIRPAKGEWAFAATLCGAVMTYFCANVFAEAGGVALSRGVWLLPALWILSGWGLDRHEAHILTPKEGEHETETSQLEAPAG